MRQLALLLLLPMPLVAAQATLAAGSAPGQTWSQEPSPGDDPYIPPAGSPDIAGDDGLGSGNSDLNPNED